MDEHILVSQAKTELSLGERYITEHLWADAARSFRRAADFFHGAGEHTKEGEALRRAAYAYERLQTWRIAAETWLDAARALGGHVVKPPSPREPKTREGEAYLWAGNTFFWSGQHYESFYAHVLAGQAFEAAEDWPRAERAYRSAAISRAIALGTLHEFNRDAHDVFRGVQGVNLVEALQRTAEKRQQGGVQEREFVARSHIDSLFSVRRALEAAGNQEEARALYKYEMTARYNHAKKYGPWRRRLWLTFFGTVLGYGESVANLLVATTLLFVVIFPILYTIVPTIHGADNIWERVYFSIVTATTLGYGDMSPRGWARLLANLESVLGLVAFGLLVAVLVRHVSR